MYYARLQSSWEELSHYDSFIEWPASAPSEKVPIPPIVAEIYAKIVEKTRVFQFLAELNPDFKIPSETSAMAVRYAYPAPPSVPSQTSHTSSPSLSPLPAASDCQASSVAPDLPTTISSPLSGIKPSLTASIVTDDDLHVSHSDDDRLSAIRKEKRMFNVEFIVKCTNEINHGGRGKFTFFCFMEKCFGSETAAKSTPMNGKIAGRLHRIREEREEMRLPQAHGWHIGYKTLKIQPRSQTQIQKQGDTNRKKRRAIDPEGIARRNVACATPKQVPTILVDTPPTVCRHVSNSLPHLRDSSVTEAVVTLKMALSKCVAAATRDVSDGTHWLCSSMSAVGMMTSAPVRLSQSQSNTRQCLAKRLQHYTFWQQLKLSRQRLGSTAYVSPPRHYLVFCIRQL
ncbi:hypothetical protein GIB67_008661 [Kingdonia uniflora]|uniref:Uncharacterized protein n=1 Tax=Kingdonia uniflora TaxID=39325 RepID=A0A7J7M551_9MAGN|nr:hypothetical protein GIB67_008661 [Kingdonia uniflora]